MERLLQWWERSLIFALLLSIALLGVGRVEFFDTGVRMSAWSVSRTTFVFWIIFKLLLVIRGGWAHGGFGRLRPLAPLLVFFIAVTASLLPNLRLAGDYRYFFFACFHAVMLVDLFSSARERRWLPLLLGIVPLVIVARGLADNPSVLIVDLSQRFGYPLDHPNTAGYLFSMSLPIGATIALARSGWWRGLSLVSCAGQLIGLILTFSRGAWLGSAAAALYLAVGLKKWMYLAILAIVAATWVLYFPSIQDRLFSVARMQDAAADRGRLQLFTGAAQLGLNHPVFGVGYGRARLREALRPYLKGTEFEQEPIPHTHNVYIELFAGTGLLGLLAFLWLGGQTLKRLWRNALGRNEPERFVGLGLAAAWLAAMVTAFGDIPFYHHETRIFFFTLYAMAHMDEAAASN
jgi:O-antigen ligase